jgi:hypothetical protein
MFRSSNCSNTRLAKAPAAPGAAAESRTSAPVVSVSAHTAGGLPLGSATSQVPGFSGSKVLAIRSGIFCASQGTTLSWCSTFAPSMAISLAAL